MKRKISLQENIDISEIPEGFIKDIPRISEASEDTKKIAAALDYNLHLDIIVCKDNNVMIRTRLGDKVLGMFPVHCSISEDGSEVLITEYEP